MSWSIRITCRITGIVFIMLLLAAPAHADQVWTTRSTVLRAGPSTLSRTVGKLEAIRPLTVVRKQGRWIEVSRGRKSGWVESSSVAETRRRALRRERLAERKTGERDRETAERDRETAGRDREAENPAAVSQARDFRGASSTPTAAAAPASEQPVAAAAPASEQPVAAAAPASNETPESCKNRSLWCGEHGRGGGTRLQVAIHAVEAFAKPSASERAVFTLRKDDVLIVIGRDRSGWYLVQSPKGKVGWVPGAAVRDRSNLARAAEPAVGAAAAPAARLQASATARAPGPTDHSRLRARASVGSGYAATGRLLVAAGDAGYLSIYGGLAARVATDASVRISGKWHVGVDATYGFVGGAADIAYEDTGGTSARDIEFVSHHVATSAKLGYAGSFGAFLRAGYSFAVYNIEQLDNPARLPREHLSSPTMGFEVMLPELVSSLSTSVRADVHLLSTRVQTPGLEDGAAIEAARAATAEVAAMYRMGSRLYLEGTYQYGVAITTWSGASARAPELADAERTDQSHTMTLGLGARF